MIRERSDIRGETIKSILTSGMSLPLCYKLCLHVGPQPRLKFSASSSYKENLQPLSVEGFADRSRLRGMTNLSLQTSSGAAGR